MTRPLRLKKPDPSHKPKKPKARVLSTYRLMGRFPDEGAAIAYLTPILWPDGPVCPYCGGRRIADRRRDDLHRCKDCRKDFTIRVGTIFHRSQPRRHGEEGHILIAAF